MYYMCRIYTCITYVLHMSTCVLQVFYMCITGFRNYMCNTHK